MKAVLRTVRREILLVELMSSLPFCMFAYISKLGSWHPHPSLHRHPTLGPAHAIPGPLELTQSQRLFEMLSIQQYKEYLTTDPIASTADTLSLISPTTTSVFLE